jgi:F-type H+-transporting ATPase subunit b
LNSLMPLRRRPLDACPAARKRGRPRRRIALCAPWALSVLVALLLLAAPARAVAQPEPSAATAGESRNAPQEEGGGGALGVAARLFNFAILAGTLVYLLKSPLVNYLERRRTDIRRDLIQAAETKKTAAAQIEDIDRRLQALPAELAALRAHGAQETAAEDARIRAAAAADRDRLLEQARRDIDQHVRIAERDLVAHAADLAVGVAADRIRQTITDDDQRRLVDRYVQQLKR